MTTAITKPSSDVIDSVVVKNDLKELTSDQRVAYYKSVCDSMGLNPMTQPFAYIELNGKLTLYCTKAATDQLRKIHGVSITIASSKTVNDIFIVTARATDKEGRSDESTGAVTIGNLTGDKLCNALMKAETKAKRRVTLSLCGLGWLDESEIETIPNARIEKIDPVTGEVIQLTAAAPVDPVAERSAKLRDKALKSLPKSELLDWQTKVMKACEEELLTQEDQLRLSVALNDERKAREQANG